MDSAAVAAGADARLLPIWPVNTLTVLLTDPRLDDPHWCAMDDVDTLDLRSAIMRLRGVHIEFWDDHTRLINRLVSSPPEFIVNLIDDGYRNNDALEPALPGLFEMLNIPYTGSGPHALAIALDKSLVRGASLSMGVPVPHEVYVHTADELDALLPPDDTGRYPLFLKPCRVDGSMGIAERNIVRCRADARAVGLDLLREFPGRGLLVQQFLPGPEYTVAIVGNAEAGDLRCLPTVEKDFRGDGPNIYTYAGKRNASAEERAAGGQRAPAIRARLDAAEEARLHEYAQRIYNRVGLRDYARVDFRRGSDGNLYLIDLNPNCWVGGMWRTATTLADVTTYEGAIELMLRASMRRQEKLIMQNTVAAGLARHLAGARKLPLAPPVAERRHTETVIHGEALADELAWLSDRDLPEVRKLMRDENHFTDRMLLPLAPLQRRLLNELTSRVVNNRSPGLTLGEWTYYSRNVEGREHPIMVRTSYTGTDEVVLDKNALADEFDADSYLHVGMVSVSPDHKAVAFGVDTVGNERFVVHVREIGTNRPLRPPIAECDYGLVWSTDATYIFVARLDDVERPDRVLRFLAREPDAEGALVYYEPDVTCAMQVQSSCDGRYLLMTSGAQVTSEVRYLPLSTPTAAPSLIVAKRKDVEYSAEPWRDRFFVVIYENHDNGRIVSVPIGEHASLADAEVVLPVRDYVLIEGIVLRERFLVVFERTNCVQNIRVVRLVGPRPGQPGGVRYNDFHYVHFDESVYAIDPIELAYEEGEWAMKPNYTSATVRFGLSSMVQPRQTIEYDMQARTQTAVTEMVVPNYDPSLYVQERRYLLGADGTAIPVSMVYRRDARTEDVAMPTLLRAYGAYGSSIDPSFTSNRLSLLDRGVCYVIVHARGGSEMGNAWYRDGKLARKNNGISDLIAAAEGLIRDGLTTPDRLCISGRSAGGLLVASAAIKRPDLFRCVILDVPFVDVINTMLDESMPWTAYEYEEWGNPRADKRVFDAMKAYDPYFICGTPANYPAVMTSTGTNDPRVGSHEALKFIQKLRGSDRGRHPKLLRILGGGHGAWGKGRYGALEYLAEKWAFVLSQIGADRLEPLPTSTSTTSIDAEGGELQDGLEEGGPDGVAPHTLKLKAANRARRHRHLSYYR